MSSGGGGGGGRGDEPLPRGGATSEGGSLPLGAGPTSAARAPSPSDPLTAERAATAGYDTRGGASSELALDLSRDRLGVVPTPNTLTSGSVGGEAWQVDPLTREGERALQAHLARDHAAGGPLAGQPPPAAPG